MNVKDISLEKESTHLLIDLTDTIKAIGLLVGRDTEIHVNGFVD